jgi:hypothetical protein
MTEFKTHADYLSQFMSLKCAGDVLNIVNPLGAKASKEITESMGMIKQIKKIALTKPMYYSLVDFCAGNALTSILSVFMLPIKNAIAIDKRPRKREWGLASRFIYNTLDIHEPLYTENPSIFIAVHACGDLANRVIDLYLQNEMAKHLFLMPCCEGSVSDISGKVPRGIIGKINRYDKWAWNLALRAGGDFVYDEKIKSPKNAIVIAHKE